MIHCFRNWIIDNNKRKEVLNQTIKETNIGNQTVPHTNSFTGSETIVKSGINEHHCAEVYFTELSVLLKQMFFFCYIPLISNKYFRV